MSTQTLPELSRVAQARDRLVAHLLTHVSDGGAVRDRCSSRALESALTLVLLRDARQHHDRQAQIAGYLRTHPAGPGTFDRLLVDAALQAEYPSQRPHRATAWLESFDHFTATRKLLTFNTVLAVLGAIPFSEDVDPDAIRYRGITTWGDVTLCAVKLLHLHARGRCDDASLAFLTDRLARDGGKPALDRNVFAYLLALTALHRCDPGHRLVDDGIADLLSCQNPDGGLPFVDGMEIFCTATAGLSLLTAPGLPRHLPTAMGDYLAERQLADGGWAYAENVRQSDVDTAAYSLQFLRALDPARYATQIDAGDEYLLAIANPDGGFPTFRLGHPSEIAMTAGALTALSPDARGRAEIAQAALEYLLTAQQPDGTFERSWSLSEANSIFRALQSLQHTKHLHPSPTRARINQATSLAMSRLATTQHPDGGWGHQPAEPSDPISTSYALLVTRNWHTTPTHRAGLGYLLAQQQPDGGFTSRPDQAAPRPIPYDVPVLADICALSALNPTSHLQPPAPNS